MNIAGHEPTSDAPPHGGRVHVVTGGASGIGAEVVAMLAMEPDSCVVVVDIDAAGARQYAEQLSACGRNVLARPTDVTEPEQVDQLFGEVIARHHRVDTLVCCAGALGPMAFTDTTPVEWDRVMRVNLDSTFLLARRAIPAMADRRTGRIVVVASVNARKPGPYLVPYRVSKAALLMLVRCLAMEAAKHRITVNAVSPGVVMTPMQRAVITAKVGSSPAKMEEYLAARSSQIPLGRLTETRDVAGVIRFLLSDEASMCTGQEIVVDGGEYQAL